MPRSRQPMKESRRITRRSFIARVGLIASGSAFPLAAIAQPAMVKTDKAAIDGKVWGGLVYASDTKPAERQPAPESFPDVAARLAKVFPFKHYQILGQHDQDIFREYESWVVPSKDLFLKLDSKGTVKNGGLRVGVQFWQGQQVLVKTDVTLRPGSPLFIAGPKWRDGRLIFVLLLKKAEARRRVP